MSTVTITDDEVTPFLIKLDDALANPRPLLAAVGSRVVDELRDHFTDRDAEGNKHGWPSQHFWGQIREATGIGSLSDEAVEVAVADSRFGFKVRGGTILPVNKSALTIPLHEMAYGLRAGSSAGGFSGFTETTGIELFRPKRSDGEPSNVLAGMVGDRMEFFYALVKSAHHEPDPRALPDSDEMAASILEEVHDYVDAVG